MPFINVRWADNTDQLRKNLREGLNQIEATRASAEKMAKSLSGDNLIAAAHRYAAAVQQIGGVEKLTAAEKAKINALLDKAIEKYQALGQVAPTALRELAAATATAEQKTSVLGETFKGVLAGFTAANAVERIVSGFFEFGRAILADADALTRMRDTTGISIAGLQLLRTAAEDSGNSLDEVTSAITQLQNRIGSGDSSATGALRKLGLSLEDLQRMAPQQQFVDIGKALATVHDPAQQVALAIDLFGRSGAQVLPTLKANFDELGQSAMHASADAVEAADRFGDSWGKATSNFKNWMLERVVNLTSVLAGRAGALADVMREIDRIQKMAASVPSPNIGGAAGTIPTMGPAELALAEHRLTETLNDQIEARKKAEAQKKRERAEAEALREAIARLEVITSGYRNSVGELDSTELKSIERFLAKQKAAEDLTAALLKLATVQAGRIDAGDLPGDSTNELGGLKARFDANKEALAAQLEQARQMHEVWQLLDQDLAMLGDTGDETFKRIIRVIRAAIQALQVMLTATLAENAALAAQNILKGFGAGFGLFLAFLSSGGTVKNRKVEYFDEGRTVGPFIPRGRDVVPAMLAEDEIVLNANQQRAVSALMARGGVGGGVASGHDSRSGGVVVHMDNRGAFFGPQADQEIARRVVKAVSQNKGGTYSRGRAALGLKS